MNKPAKPDKSARKSAPHQGGNPSPQETNTLIALFNKGSYTEVVTLARTLTGRFPQHEFGWQVLGAAFMQMGRNADALVPMQQAVALLPGDAVAHNNLCNTLNGLNRLVEAEASCRRALDIKANYAGAHYNLGISLNGQGRLSEAEACYRRALEIKPDFAEAHSNLGNILSGLNRLDEAEVSCRQAIQIKPDLAIAHSNLGNILMNLDRLDEAELSYRRVLEINPHFAEAHNNLGNIFMNLGHPNEAEACYRRALEIKPDFAEAQCNLGNIFNNSGRLDEAVACYHRALKIKPDFAVGYNHLGNTLKDLGRLDEAEASYIQALQIKPDYSDALNNLALLFNIQGKTMKAFNICKHSLHIKETEAAKNIFFACVQRMSWTYDDSEIRAYLVRALTEPWGRPKVLSRSCIDMIKLNVEIRSCVARANDAWPLRLTALDLLGSNGLSALASDKLLCALLNSAPICDIEMEHFLTMSRRVMLETASGMTASDVDADSALSFYGALARQCFINEYVFSHTDDEIQIANDLRDSVVTALQAKTPIPAVSLVALASYFPLCSLPGAIRLLDSQWPGEVELVLTQQVREPADELQLRTTIPRLTSIQDDVSVLVRSQYEENPYPRWVKAAPSRNSLSIDEYLCQKFPLTNFKRDNANCSFDFLIAGCGTGQQSIQTAQTFRGAKILAVDLSLSSLSYAKRKTRELGLTSIEYAHADLLKLNFPGPSFDVIESSGVLHHLANPWAGWQVLLSLLRPGGYMQLGFYSEVARRDIVRIRTLISEQGYGSTANEIRRCRQDLVSLDNGADFGTTLKSGDFFSTSTCRDLLFHVQEHRMSLTGINAFLRENNLAFLGFEIDAESLRAYKLRFPDDPAAANLDQWQIFENENPATFISMYNFWIRKKC